MGKTGAKAETETKRERVKRPKMVRVCGKNVEQRLEKQAKKQVQARQQGRARMGLPGQQNS